MSVFKKFSIDEFEKYISEVKIARTILFIQEHHTYIPSYVHFKGKNHLALQTGMRNTHINSNGWSDIGQHFTTFPDGTIMTGRDIEKTPACIYGNNAHSICIENLGNFDSNKDEMTIQQKQTIIRMSAALCKKFNFPASTNKIVYHHWFNLSTGERNNGGKNNKSCPGTNFFGGNKVKDCEENFLPLLKNLLQSNTPNPPLIPVMKYVIVTSNSLNIRIGASTSSPILKDRKPASFGSVLRVFKEKNGWYKISSSSDHWVYGKLTKDVKHAVVNTDSLNIRTGASQLFPKIDALLKGQEVFIIEEKNSWSRISMEEKWINTKYLKF